MFEWLRRHSSLVAVLGMTAAWVAVEALAPGLLERALHAPGSDRPIIGEGPLESVQLAVLGAGSLLWLAVAGRCGRSARWLAAGLAVAMAAQLGFVAGEEMKWGYQLDWRPLFGFGEWCPPSPTLRSALRYGGLLPESLTGPVVGAYLLYFLAGPWVRFEAHRKWRARAEPAVATIEEGRAFVAVPLAWLGAGLLIGAFPDDELIQLGLYVIAVGAAVRILRTR